MSGVSEPKIVVIGGGTGSFTLLGSLKRHTSQLTALVNMADDGGSTGILRDELGVLPPGDVRQCLVALSESSQALRELFSYRFPSKSTLAGHSFGNLFLSAVEMMTDDFGEAVQLASEVLNITGRVLPITLQNCNLIIKTDDGTIIEGEYKIGNLPFDGKKSSPELWLEPKAKINPLAASALMEAELVVIAPGNLYGSLAPTLLVEGVADMLHKTEATVAYVCNLVNKPIQTQGFAIHNYVSELERFIGPGAIDVVLYNEDHPSKQILDAYALDGEFPVEIDHKALRNVHYKVIGGHFLHHLMTKRNPNDTRILRSLIRHDADSIAKELLKLL